jgi:hypothetical protein
MEIVMKKQILALMACAVFLVPTSGFCMETDEDLSDPVHRVFNTPELSVKILGHLELKDGYSIRFMPYTENLSQLKYGELGVFCQNDGQLYCKIADKPKMKIIRSIPAHSIYSDIFYKDPTVGIYSKYFDKIFNAIFQINIDGASGCAGEECLSNSEIASLLRYTKSHGYTLPDLTTTELVSKEFCSSSRFFITSISTPIWATDEELEKYSDQLPNLKGLKIVSGNHTKPDENGIMRGLPSKISDASLAKLTKLTTLNLQSDANITNDSLTKLTNLTNLTLTRNRGITDDGLNKLMNLSKLKLQNCNITDDGIKNLANLTFLDSESFWKLTDDGLIDSLGKPRHLKLKLFLLPNEHQITESAIDVLEENGATVKESEYSVI